MVLTPNFSATDQAYAYHTYDNHGETNHRVILIQRKREGWEEVKSGDKGNGELAQAESSLGGKILRMKLDGTVPEDNPVSGSYVYINSYRNSWNCGTHVLTNDLPINIISIYFAL